MEQNGERPSFILPPPTLFHSAAAEESSAEYDVSRIIGHEFRQGVPFFNVAWDTK